MEIIAPPIEIVGGAHIISHFGSMGIIAPPFEIVGGA